MVKFKKTDIAKQFGGHFSNPSKGCWWLRPQKFKEKEKIEPLKKYLRDRRLDTEGKRAIESKCETQNFDLIN